MRLDPSPDPSVTPDVFRGPPGRKRMAPSQAFLLAAEWTPEHVRGDEVGMDTLIETISPDRFHFCTDAKEPGVRLIV
jgi:hypothetical protein